MFMQAIQPKTLLDTMRIKPFASGNLPLIMCLIIYLFTGTPPARAQEILTLKKALEKGLASNKSLLSGTLEQEKLKLKTKELQRGYQPTLLAEYNYQYNPVLPTSILPIGVFNPNFPPDATQSVRFGTSWSQTAGLSLDQPLLDFSIKRKIEEARLAEKITSASNDEKAYEWAHAIVSSYIQLYILEAEQKEAMADSLRTYLSYSLQRSRFEENRLLKADLNKAKINHNNTVQKLADKTSRLEEEKIFLLYLTGSIETANTDFIVDTTFFTESLLEWYDKSPALERLPAWQRISLQYQQLDQQAAIEKAALLPTVSLKGYLGANQFTNTFNPFAPGTWFGLSFVGLTANIPIISRTNLSGRLRQIQLQSDQSALEKAQIQEDLSRDVLTIRLQLEKLHERLKTLEENLVLSEESLRIYQNRFKEGLESASIVNTEETGFQLLKAEYETEKKRMWLNWLEYIKSTGLLWELMPPK